MPLNRIPTVLASIAAAALLLAGCGTAPTTSTDTSGGPNAPGSSPEAATTAATVAAPAFGEQVGGDVKGIQGLVGVADGNSLLHISVNSEEVIAALGPDGTEVARTPVGDGLETTVTGLEEMNPSTAATGAVLQLVTIPAQGVNDAGIQVNLLSFDQTATLIGTTPVTTAPAETKWFVDGVTSDGEWYVAHYRSALYFVQPTTGKVVEHKSDQLDTWSPRLLGNGVLMQCDPKTPTPIGQCYATPTGVKKIDALPCPANADSKCEFVNAPLEPHGYAFGNGGPVTGGLNVVDPATGQVIFDVKDWSGGGGYDPLSGTFIVFDVAGPTTRVGGLSSDGTELWHAEANYCGVIPGYVIVAANKQIAALDAKTGKQLAFSANSTACPEYISSSGYGASTALVGGVDSLKVTGG